MKPSIRPASTIGLVINSALPSLMAEHFSLNLHTHASDLLASFVKGISKKLLKQLPKVF
jgi:hypothetical protein